ncbi:MAG: pilus assembly protein N-terminal domain-containing protein, partial [Gemmataceae bacterium]
MSTPAAQGRNVSQRLNAIQRRKTDHQRGWLATCCAAGAWLSAAAVVADEPNWQPMALAQAPQPAPPAAGKQMQPAPAQPGILLPPPRTIEGFRPGQIRLQRMGTQGPLGTTPKPTEKDLAEQRQFVQEVVDPHNVLDLVVNRTRILVTKEAPRRVQMGDEKVATYSIISPTEIALIGQQVNTTVLNLWFADPKDPKKEKILSYLIRVIPDPEVRERLERTYHALQDEINNAFPDSLICLTLVGDKLVLTGQPKDVAEATEILKIVQSNAPGGGGGGAGGGGGGPGQARGTPNGIPVDNLQQTGYNPGDINAPNGLPGLNQFLLAGGSTVINLMRIPGEQQVMLKVVVAEINRSAARSIGVNFNITNNNGVTVFGQNTGNLSGGGAGGFGGGGGALGGGGGGVGGS